jgi:hypothetical protein
MNPMGPGEYRYAVAVPERGGLWLALWVKRDKDGQFFVFHSRSDPMWKEPHTSYHKSGQLHSRSFGDCPRIIRMLPPPTVAFRGTVQLGIYAGHDPLRERMNCDPAEFSGVVEVSSGVLGPAKDAVIVVDLVEPGCEPLPAMYPILQRQTFQDFEPWLVITVEERPIKTSPD